MGLSEYISKRDFKQTPEPVGGEKNNAKELTFVVQRHDARRLHYDFRLELEGVLKSWAIPKGPSMKAGDKRLAVMVEDHPLDYAQFYGKIPEGNYGAGLVDLWDEGTYQPYKPTPGKDPQEVLIQQLEKGDVKITLNGHHLKGSFALIRLKEDGKPGNNWLLIKKNDDFDVKEYDIEKVKPLKYGSEGEDFVKAIDKAIRHSSDLINRKESNKGKVKSHIKDTIDSTEKIHSKDHKGEPRKIIDKTIDLNKGNEQIVTIEKKKLKLTNLSKVYWPEEGYTKADLINYYLRVSNFILPYLKNRPQSLNRFPNGIKGPSFYQKDMEVTQLPEWVKTERIYSKANDKEIDYLICNDVSSLAFMANLGCIEINPWHSTYTKQEYPDYLMIDLDPGDISFDEVVNTALVVHEISEELKIKSYCKTSGASGLHIYIPLGAKYDYDHVKIFAEILAGLVQSRIPEVTTIERSIAKRGNKIYVDFLQNRKGQTIVAPYSVRPQPLATVSTPLLWSEVKKGLDPRDFTISNIFTRLEKVGDLWAGIFKQPIDILKVINKLEKLK